MAMDNARVWRSFFHEWPSQLPTRGVVVTTFGEQIPFINYLISDTLLILERRAPDSLGGRTVILPFGQIDAVKIVDPIKTEVLLQSGFQPASSGTQTSVRNSETVASLTTTDETTDVTADVKTNE
jgi:hypothetical protein